jgi:hypothetical protein
MTWLVVGTAAIVLGVVVAGASAFRSLDVTAARQRRRGVAVYLVAFAVVVALAIVGEGTEDPGRSLNRVMFGVHGEGLLSVLGVVAGLGLSSVVLTRRK